MDSLVDIPNTMSAVLLVGHGGPENLVYRDDVQVPHPGPQEVLVRVEAAAINNTDINTRKAWYSKGQQESSDASWSGQALQFPRIQGADVCGTVVRVGSDIDEARIGERVLIEPCIREAKGEDLKAPWYFGSECDGGFADYTTVAARHAHRVESDLSSVELATFPCAYSTAENMLTRAEVSEGDRVLVTGASGGVGSAAVQLAKARGANVVAVTSTSKFSSVLSIGADEVIDRDDDMIVALGANSVDVVVDLVAGPSWPALIDIIRPGGRYTVSGAIGGPIVELDVRTLYLKDLTFLGCTVLGANVFSNLVARIESKQIAPLVAEVYTLSEIAAAQASFETKNHVGKIVFDLQKTEP